MDRNNRFIPLLILVVLVLIFAITYTRIGTTNAKIGTTNLSSATPILNSNNSYPGPSNPDPTPFDPYKDQISFLTKELQQTDLSPDDRNSLQAKLDAFSKIATREASLLLTPIPTYDPYRIILTPTPPKNEGKMPDGIYKPADENRPLPSYNNNSTLTSGWIKTTPNRHYLIYAGYVTSDPQQGMLLEFQPNSYSVNRYLTPRKSGSVEITAEQGTYITLTAKNGDIFYFDAAREQFIDTLSYPTVTSPPTTVTVPLSNPYP